MIKIWARTLGENWKLWRGIGIGVCIGMLWAGQGGAMAWAKPEPKQQPTQKQTAAPQHAAKPASPTFKKRTVIDLSGAVIEGALTRPEGAYIVERKASRFSALIKLRKDFLPELAQSVDAL